METHSWAILVALDNLDTVIALIKLLETRVSMHEPMSAGFDARMLPLSHDMLIQGRHHC